MSKEPNFMKGKVRCPKCGTRMLMEQSSDDSRLAMRCEECGYVDMERTADDDMMDDEEDFAPLKPVKKAVKKTVKKKGGKK